MSPVMMSCAFYGISGILALDRTSEVRGPLTTLLPPLGRMVGTVLGVSLVFSVPWQQCSTFYRCTISIDGRKRLTSNGFRGHRNGVRMPENFSIFLMLQFQQIFFSLKLESVLLTITRYLFQAVCPS